MNCPLCNVELKMADRQGVEIDYCPQCRGVWLDRGELDKIIERSTTISGYNEPMQGYQGEHHDRDHDHDHDHHDNYGYGDGYHKRKKRGFLGDMFDFGD